MTIPDTHDRTARETEDILNGIVKSMQDHITCDVGLCIDCYWLWRIQQTAIDALRSIGAREERERRMEKRGIRQKRVVAAEGRGWVDLQRYEESHPGRVCVSFYGPRGGFLGNTWFYGQRLLDGLAEIGFVREAELSDVSTIIREYISGHSGQEEVMKGLEGVNEEDFVNAMLGVIHKLAESDDVSDDQLKDGEPSE